MADQQVEQKTENKKETVWKKVLNISLDVLFALFVLLGVFLISANVSANKNNGTIVLFNNQLRIIETGSMAENKNYTKEEYKSFKIKNLPIETLISIDDITKKSHEKRDAFYATLKRGDVLTFKYPVSGLTSVVTHRITKVEQLGDRNFYSDDYTQLLYTRPNYKITLKGDAVEGEGGGLYQIIETARDEEDPTTYVIGKVTWASLPAGKMTKFTTSKWGIMVFVIIPCGVLLAYEVNKIAFVIVRERKAKKDQKKLSEKDEEIEELRKKLAELESKSKKEEETKEES